MLCKGLHLKVELAEAKLGISKEKAAKLLIGLAFDGFIVHLKNLNQLLLFHDSYPNLYLQLY